MNFKSKITLFTICIFFASYSFVSAEDIPISDVLGSSEITAETNLEDQENAREEVFLNQLSLAIPTQTDNPSHIITFKDPSSEKKGVQLEIDSQSYQEITSPYSLPALGIGQHALSFKFVDESGATQILEKELIILPRAPIINSPTQNAGVLTISGTGLANSELVLILASSSNIVTKETVTSADGTWTITINESLVDGIYTFTGYARKYGYSSNLAESVTFEYGQSNIIGNNSTNKENIHFSFKDIDLNNILTVFKENVDLVILLVVTFILGAATSSLISNIIREKKEKKNIMGLEKKISSKTENSLTIFEKLSGTKKEEENTKEIQVEKEIVEEKKEEEKKEPKTEERIVTKIDFLKGYKKFDPDEGKKEVDDSKKIKISLTSKG